jgi:hypothetical protein
MDYMDEYVNAFDHEFDEDDFDEDYDDDFQDDEYFQTFDYPFDLDLMQRRDWRQRDRFDGDRFRPIGNRRRVRCCVYRNRNTGRMRRVCQDRNRRCANRLGRNWILVRTFTTNNCNRCI